jgi:hypothetical protein
MVNAMPQEDGTYIVTTLSLSQVAEQVILPKLGSKYPWLTRNVVVKLLKFTQRNIHKWLDTTHLNPEEVLLSEQVGKNLIFTEKTLTKYYEDLKGA